MVSLIMTHYDPEGKNALVFAQACFSLGNNCLRAPFELIVADNKPSYVEAVNFGLSEATGDYLIVLNDDIVIHDSGFLDKMCDPEPNIIVGWRLGGSHLIGDRVPDAACWSMSREVFNRLGLMDLRYKDGRNFEDTDYFMHAKKLGIKFKDAGVNMEHIGAVTANAYQENRTAKQMMNERLFREKWGL